MTITHRPKLTIVWKSRQAEQSSLPISVDLIAAVERLKNTEADEQFCFEQENGQLILSYKAKDD